MKKRSWTPAQDAEILRLRAEGVTWKMIATALGLSRTAVVERGRRIYAAQPTPMPAPAPKHDHARPPDPLPAGHPLTWGLICSDPYPPYGS